MKSEKIMKTDQKPSIHKARYGNGKTYYVCCMRFFAYKCNSTDDWSKVTCKMCLKHKGENK